MHFSAWFEYRTRNEYHLQGLVISLNTETKPAFQPNIPLNSTRLFRAKQTWLRASTWISWGKRTASPTIIPYLQPLFTGVRSRFHVGLFPGVLTKKKIKTSSKLSSKYFSSSPLVYSVPGCHRPNPRHVQCDDSFAVWPTTTPVQYQYTDGPYLVLWRSHVLFQSLWYRSLQIPHSILWPKNELDKFH